MPTTDMYAFGHVRTLKQWVPPYPVMGSLSGPLLAHASLGHVDMHRGVASLPPIHGRTPAGEATGAAAWPHAGQKRRRRKETTAWSVCGRERAETGGDGG